VRSLGGPGHTQDVAAAANRHAFAESDLGGHAEGDFDFGACLEGDVGEKENSARAEILGEAKSFKRGCDLAERKRQKIREPLSGTAFHTNWRSGHKRSPSLPRSREAQALLYRRAGDRRSPKLVTEPNDSQIGHSVALEGAAESRNRGLGGLELWKTLT
jgi:hypothetical protein